MMLYTSQRCHALGCCQYMVVLCILLSSSRIITTYAKPHDLPYALGFYFLNTSLPAGTCQTELDLVTNASYPVYESQLTVDSTLTPTDLQALAAASSTTTTAGAPLTRHRNQKRRQLRQRQLQQFCYTYCNTMPQAWLIARGCKDECGRRRLEEAEGDDAAERQDKEETVSLISTMNHHDNDRRNAMTTLSSILTSNYYTKDGSADKIMNGQGDDAAKAFYAAASSLINASNPCRQLILSMTYTRVPMLVNV